MSARPIPSRWRCPGPLLAWMAAMAMGCTDDASFPVEAGPTEVAFPSSFLWGSATAAFQIESGLPNTDWAVWAALPGKIANDDQPDDGPDALNHIEEDVALMRAAGHTTYRFGIEMARVYPTQESLDQNEPDRTGLASYDALVDALVDAGITPMVTLHHFVWPDYLSDPRDNDPPQGWERVDARLAFQVWCHHMAEHFGDRVDLWITINEPTAEANVGYLATVFPPGVSDIERTVAVLRHQVDSHARCYDALHMSDQVDADGDGAAALVSIASHNRAFEPANPDDVEDRAAAAHARRFWNTWFFDAIVRGDLDQNFDDAIDVEGDPELEGRADFIGVNYYSISRIDSAALEQPYMGVVPPIAGQPTGRPKTDMDWDIHAAGLAEVLDEVRNYGLPIYITENGIADAEDRNRARFLAEHAWQIGLAIDRGIDVRGYYHWSLIDNFEWAAGFCPRFGLHRVDFDDPARPRTPTAAVDVLADLAETQRLTRAAIDALPPYESRPHPCAGF